MNTASFREHSFEKSSNAAASYAGENEGSTDRFPEFLSFLQENQDQMGLKKSKGRDGKEVLTLEYEPFLLLLRTAPSVYGDGSQPSISANCLR